MNWYIHSGFVMVVPIIIFSDVRFYHARKSGDFSERWKLAILTKKWRFESWLIHLMGNGSHSMHALALGTQLYRNIKASIYFHSQDHREVFLSSLLSFLFFSHSTGSIRQMLKIIRSRMEEEKPVREWQYIIYWHCFKNCLKSTDLQSYKV